MLGRNYGTKCKSRSTGTGTGGGIVGNKGSVVVIVRSVVVGRGWWIFISRIGWKGISGARWYEETTPRFAKLRIECYQSIDVGGITVSGNSPLKLYSPETTGPFIFSSILRRSFLQPFTLFAAPTFSKVSMAHNTSDFASSHLHSLYHNLACSIIAWPR